MKWVIKATRDGVVEGTFKVGGVTEKQALAACKYFYPGDLDGLVWSAHEEAEGSVAGESAGSK